MSINQNDRVESQANQPSADDERIELILEMITRIAAGNMQVRLPISERFDALDGIITGLNMLADELHENMVSRQWFEGTLSSIGDAVIATDVEGLVTFMNPEAERITGYQLHETKGSHINGIFQIINSRTRQVLPNPVMEVLRQGKLVEISNHTLLISKSGKEYYIDDGGAPIKNHDTIVGVVLIFRDVTQRYLTETKLQQKQKLEALGTLAGGIAHDFNNSLSAILGNAELLQTLVKDNQQAQHHAGQIIKATDHASRLVKQILSFSRMEEGQFKPLRLNQLIRDGLQMLHSTTPANIVIDEQLPQECPTMLGDPTQINQILLNLCTNAIQAMTPQGGTLTVQVTSEPLRSHQQRDSSTVWLIVTDTGPGIPDHLMERIFDPFFTTKEDGSGTGLGLSVVHGIVDKHGGEISVESRINQGTTFTIGFPVQETPIIIESSPQKINSIHTGRVLLAEDDDLLRNLYVTFFKNFGFEVEVHENGKEALECFSKYPYKFDLVLTDQSMPKMSGKQLSLEILAIRPDIPIILMTGFSDVISEEEAIRMGIRSYIHKPVQLIRLLEEVSSLIKDNGAAK